MDRETLLAHRTLWVQEPATQCFAGEAPHLTADEHALFDDLRADRICPRVRLEQERVGYAHVRAALDALR